MIVNAEKISKNGSKLTISYGDGTKRIIENKYDDDGNRVRVEKSINKDGVESYKEQIMSDYEDSNYNPIR